MVKIVLEARRRLYLECKGGFVREKSLVLVLSKTMSTSDFYLERYDPAIVVDLLRNVRQRKHCVSNFPFDWGHDACC